MRPLTLLLARKIGIRLHKYKQDANFFERTMKKNIIGHVHVQVLLYFIEEALQFSRQIKINVIHILRCLCT